MATIKAIRVDAGVVLRNPVRTPQGFLRVDGYVGRAGVYEYLNEDGSVRRELRLPEEVFSPKALGGFEGAPLTDGHPAKAVDTSNVKRLEVGTVTGPAVRSDDYAAAAMVFKDPSVIEKIEKRGKQQLSPGYSVDLEETPGNHPIYGRYDAIQRNIVINHVALVDRARGGDSMRLRMDGADDVRLQRVDAELDAKGRDNLKDSSFAVPDREGLPIEDKGHLDAAMARFGQYEFQDAAEKKAAYGRIIKRAKILGVDSTGFEKRWSTRLDAAIPRRGVISMDQEEQIRSLKTQLAEAEKLARERKDALDEATARADKAEAVPGPLKDRIVELETKIAAGETTVETEAIRREKTRADEAEAAVRRFDEKLPGLVKTRTALMHRAATVMGFDFRMDDMSERQIHSAVVKRLDSNADVKDCSDAYLAGRFDTLIELHGKTARALSHVAANITGGDAVNQGRVDERETRRREFRDQWKKPLPNDIRARKDG